ncbi:hypothetical protein [Sphingobacterium sp. JUb56]|uniref:hypothetical protein n=1 Tax=Sphingobacterium sp. JUb56 TaxID=2587145 RepID=UPI00160F65BF|nr:hypothetical protein [Sphingobacterium sp. JUb56]MBB2954347.1 hypothetical protein [Sphingobacterium sp. JUb56]
MAVNLSQSNQILIQYVDYVDGFVASEIEKNLYNIKIIPFDNNRRIKLESGSLLVTPLSSIFQAARFFYKDVYVMFWSIHPLGLKEAVDFLPSHIPSISYKKYGQDLTALIAKKGLFFMDKPNFDIQRALFSIEQSHVDYLPIFSSDTIDMKVYQETKSRILHLGWLGRLCIEKVNAVINVLEHCNHYLETRPDEKIIFYIIGDGDKKTMVQNYKIHENLELQFLGILNGEQLRNFMLMNVDLMFAMGTSALEAASLSIATILVDFSFTEIPSNNRFRYLYESEGYSVGDEFHDNNKYNHDLRSILDNLKSGEITTHAKKCYDYFLSQHSEESIVNKFCSLLTAVDVRVLDVNNSNFGKYRQLFIIKSIYFKIKKWFRI